MDFSNHFIPLVTYNSPENNQKTIGFLIIPGSLEKGMCYESAKA